MPKPIAKVAVNGYGTIGKRVSDAVALQDDMKLVGIADISPNWRVKLATGKGYTVYASLPDKLELMEKGGLEVAGTLNDLLEEVDLVIDCTPPGIGATNKPRYEKAGVKAVFEGGEKADVAEMSFVAQCNYEEALGRDFVRIVSCNTTAICRSLGAFHREFGVKKARVIIVRRAADPWEGSKGPINATIPDLVTPSHHGPDAKTVLPDLNIVTLSCKVPTTLAHTHFVMVEPKAGVSEGDMLDLFRREPRMILLSAADGFDGTQTIIEFMRDLGRPRYDMWELTIFDKSISVKEGEAYWIAAVHSEAIVIPENIDAIRAMTELETNARASIEKTDESLGVCDLRPRAGSQLLAGHRAL